MTPYYADDWLSVYAGDCRDVLHELPERSVQCVVTSPPYWGLRSYSACSCVSEGRLEVFEDGRGDRHTPGGAIAFHRQSQPDPDCLKCGGTGKDAAIEARQLGLEPTPEEYVATMVSVFREVRRVLRDDGTLWLNLGDSYGTGAGPTSDKSTLRGNGHVGGGPKAKAIEPTRGHGLKPKDLVGMPWRLAFALQADGWYLRSAITLCKLNPMPESVTDRPTSATEMMFLLTKQSTYFYDATAVRERFSDERMGNPGGGTRHYAGSGRNDGVDSRMLNWDKGAGRGGRNLRNWWPVTSEPYPGAHFATFGQKWITPCIKAGTSERGCCPECGAPWVRETNVGYVVLGGGGGRRGDAKRDPASRTDLPKFRGVKVPETTGWRPGCKCELRFDLHGTEDASMVPLPVPCVVLDPFAGTGTVGLVAQRLSRRAVLIDLNPDYLLQCLGRNRAVPLGL